MAASRHVGWVYGDGNIKVAYQAGYDTVPTDLTMAANMLVTFVARSTPVGGQTYQSEGYEGYSYSLASMALHDPSMLPEPGTLLGLLGQYRELSYTTTN